MIWNICFAISLAVLAGAILYAVFVSGKSKNRKTLTAFHSILAGVFLAIFIGLIPVLAAMLGGDGNFLPKLFLFDLVQTIQVFILESGIDFILDNFSGDPAVSDAYSLYMTVLFAAAPLLTFGVLASLIKGFFSGISYLLHYWGNIYVFSELNEKALLLAKSIKSSHPGAMMVFAGVRKGGEDQKDELLEGAKELKAILFQKDIAAVNLMRHSKKARAALFAISGDEGENLLLSLRLLEKYNQRKNTDLYVFSSREEGEILLANAPRGEVKVRRVNETRSLIYNFLYNEGNRLFETAGDDKTIHAVIAGLGRFGTEMLKALAWYCQMDGYTLRIDAYDRDELAEEKIAAICPELLSEKYNGVSVPGEAEYTIRIHPGTDVSSKSFAESLAGLPDITFVFVSLGDDGENISRAANIRMLCERSGFRPVIKTVVFDPEEARALSGTRNYRGQEYGIEAMGDYESSCSEEILMGSELEKLALERHLKWGEEEEFWRYEYNYRSSGAAAIHHKARIACGIPGAEKREEDLTPKEKDTIARLEHRRWNAYMRAEGYVWSGSTDKRSRNDLAKMHHDLTGFDKLTEGEKRKDSRVGTM